MLEYRYIVERDVPVDIFGISIHKNAVLGCTNDTAANYNASATVDDGSCTYGVLGCTDDSASNYDSSATVDDGSCEYVRSQ